MTQDTIPPYRFEVIKYVSAISGDDTIFRFETVPVYLSYAKVERRILVKDIYIEPQRTAFDSVTPHDPVVFNTEPPMAEQLAYLLEKPTVITTNPYPLNGQFNSISVSLAILIVGVVAIKLYLLYEKFCRANYRATGRGLR